MIRAALPLLIALFLFIAPPAFAKVLNVQSFETPMGIDVWLVHDTTVPVISMSFSFDGGLVYDPEDKPGVGRLVSILLDEGADDMDAAHFQAALSDHAIHMSFTAGRDAFLGDIRTTRAHRDLAFDLLRKAITAPRFEADALTRMKSANTAQIKDDMGDPAWLVARTFNGMVFEGHDYAQPGFGTIESMEKIAQKDLQNFVRDQFARNALRVSIAGDITRADAIKAVDKVFGMLPKERAKTAARKATLHHAGKTILLPLDTPQTFILAGHEGIARSDPAWHASVVLNYILGGGGFDSRLMREIREKRGLTYGVYSSISSMKDATLVQANLSTRNEKAKEALSILTDEWQKMAAGGATETEVAEAKSYLTGSLLLELTSTLDIARTLNGLQRDGLDADYINQRNDEIAKVTKEDVARLAKHLLKPENLSVILVGKPEDITADIMLDHAPGLAIPKDTP